MNTKVKISMLVLISIFSLAACNEGHHQDIVIYDTDIVGQGEYQYINFPFVPEVTYHITLATYSGDADLAITDSNGRYLVYSEQNGVVNDSVLFTANHSSNQIEVYGFYTSEYELSIEEVPYASTGLNTEFDGIDFSININSFTGNLNTVLETATLGISHDYDYLTIQPNINVPWLDTLPSGTIGNRLFTLSINYLETANPAFSDFTRIRLFAGNNDASVLIFKDIDINYRLVGF